MNVVLDTNAYRAIMTGKTQSTTVVRTADKILVPVPVLAELRYGFSRGTKGRQNEAILRKFLNEKRIEILDCDDHTSIFYSQLKHQLYNAGTPIPINDVWIASLTIQHDGFLHTYDSDFDWIPQLPRI